MSERETWIDLIRNEYDPAPSHYLVGDNWDDGAGRIADAILADQVLKLRANWRPIETAPRDQNVLLGWWRDFPTLHWEYEAGLAGSSRGGWLHGQATHWMPLPESPPR